MPPVAAKPIRSGEQWIAPAILFDGSRSREGVALRLKEGRIDDIVPVDRVPAGAAMTRLDGTLTPGLFDIQVNGGGGVLFNTDCTVGGLRNLCEAHRRLGTSRLLPTVITDTPDTLDAAARAVIDAGGRFGIRGIHIEGPHIDPQRRGTHARHLIRPLDDRTRDTIAMLRRETIAVLVTLAPEAVSPGDIAALADAGVVVSLGHSNANGAAVEAALAEGARTFTHLFNAMSPMGSREPGLVGTAINSDAWCSIICDGIHVSFDMVGLAIRARPVRDRMILVSDAMATVGGPDSFELYGQSIRVEHGRLVNAEGNLAGAHVSLLECVQRLVRHVGRPLEEALRMAWTHPSQLMGFEHDIREAGFDASELMLLDRNLEFAGYLADA